VNQASQPSQSTGWINPYSFVWAPDRDSGSSQEGLGTGLAATTADHWSGWLVVELRVATPMLIPDETRKWPVQVMVTTQRKDGETIDEKTHWIYPTAVVDSESKRPRLPVTSFKGALRSTYEAITNSRYGVFDPGRRNRDDQTLVRDFLHESLRPATRPPTGEPDLSPADRLFGTVSERTTSDEPLQLRGRLRISALDSDPCSKVESVGEDQVVVGTATTEHRNALTLPALFAPKGKYAPFYLRRRNQKGGGPHPLTAGDLPFFNPPNGESGESFRTSGRKFYWHHQGFTWPNRVAPTHMNRSVSDYVPEDTRFRAALHLTNVSSDDLRDLLLLIWAFQPVDEGVEQSYFRLGYGKPLGFGSATLQLISHELTSGADLAKRIRKLSPSPAPPVLWPKSNAENEQRDENRPPWESLPEDIRPDRTATTEPAPLEQLLEIGRGQPHEQISYPRAAGANETSLDWFTRNNANADWEWAQEASSGTSSQRTFHPLPLLDADRRDEERGNHSLPELAEPEPINDESG
jgi:hypothetical protein